jgi:hypothetical protein
MSTFCHDQMIESSHEGAHDATITSTLKETSGYNHRPAGTFFLCLSPCTATGDGTRRSARRQHQLHGIRGKDFTAVRNESEQNRRIGSNLNCEIRTLCMSTPVILPHHLHISAGALVPSPETPEGNLQLSCCDCVYAGALHGNITLTLNPGQSQDESLDCLGHRCFGVAVADP